MLIREIQRQFETIYQLPQKFPIEDFLINRETLEALQAFEHNLPITFHSKGVMLLLSEEDELTVAIYLHDQVLHNLYHYNPLLGLNENNIHDFCIMAEEVSHFLYTTWRADQQIQMTKLELELQAEIDKFVICTLYCATHGTHFNNLSLKELLFENFRVEHNLPEESQNRYFLASKLALHYCHFLEQQFIKKDHLPQMVREIRRFYRLGQTDKISRINHVVLCH